MLTSWMLLFSLPTSPLACSVTEPPLRAAHVSFRVTPSRSDPGLAEVVLRATLSPGDEAASHRGYRMGELTVYDVDELSAVTGAAMLTADGPVAGVFVTDPDLVGDVLDEWSHGATNAFENHPWGLAPGQGTPAPLLEVVHDEGATAIHVAYPVGGPDEAVIDLTFLVGSRRVAGERRYVLPDVSAWAAEVTVHGTRGRPRTMPAAEAFFVDEVRGRDKSRAVSGRWAEVTTPGPGPRRLMRVDVDIDGPVGRPPREVAYLFIVDVSASMSAGAVALAEQTIAETLRAAPRDTVYALLTFDRTVRVVHGPWTQLPHPGKAAGRISVGETGKNGSAVDEALWKAALIAADAPVGREVRTVLFSDFVTMPARIPLIDEAWAAHAGTRVEVRPPAIDVDEPALEWVEGPTDRAWRIDLEAGGRPVAAFGRHLVQPVQLVGLGLAQGGFLSNQHEAVRARPRGGCRCGDDEGLGDDRLDYGTSESMTVTYAGFDDGTGRAGQTAIIYRTWQGSHHVPLRPSLGTERLLAAWWIEAYGDDDEATRAVAERYGLLAPGRDLVVWPKWRPAHQTDPVMRGYGCGFGSSGCGCCGCCGGAIQLKGNLKGAKDALIAAVNQVRDACHDDGEVAVEVAGPEILGVGVWGEDSDCLREGVWALSVPVVFRSPRTVEIPPRAAGGEGPPQPVR